MRILYGIQGTGNGHLSRSREVLAELLALGHDVRVLVSGRIHGSPPELGSTVQPLLREGLTFQTRAGRVQLLATALRLSPRRLWLDIRALDRLQPRPELVITDFEPISAWWARSRGVRSIGVGHQYAFVHPAVPLPAGNGAGKLVLRRFAPCDLPLGLHWSDFGQPILPPIVPVLPAPPGPGEPDLLLVYLPFESRHSIRACLASLTHLRCRIYGHPSGPPQERGPGHLDWRPFSRAGFLEDLGRCAGVICGAGFELPSEVIHLGRRLLVKPLHGQLEQGANALALERLGLGWARPELTPDGIARWLESPAPVGRRWPHVARRVAQWIDAGDLRQPAELARVCWSDPPFPAQPAA